MEDMGHYVCCRDCGATWNEAPRVGASLVREVDEDTGGPPRPGSRTIMQPSAYARAKISRARLTKV